MKSNVGKDGVLKLQIPIHKQTEKQYHAIEKGWPDNFFEDVVGAWSGDLVRPSQGDFEIREEL